MNAIRSLCLAILTALALSLSPSAASAQCTGGACPPCTMCRVPPAAGTNPTVAAMSTLFDQIAAGPAAYGALGWDFGTRRTIGAGAGCCSSGTCTAVPVHFPCIMLKAIYLTESSWRQFCTTNQTVISFDCGYGIAQVTSGMRPGETSAYDPNRVASDAAYNVSVGAAILADKWRASPCVGSNDPDVIEHWYFSAWGYNGFVFRNNPNNPLFAAARVEFRTPGVASAQVRGNYPYPELVWGYAHYPLTAAHYTGIGLAYPVRSEICATCGLPTMNISDPAGSHRTTCPGGMVIPPDAGAPDVVMPRDVVASDVVATDVPMGADVVSVVDVSMVDAVAPDTAVARDVGGDRRGDSSTAVDGACNCRAAGRQPSGGTRLYGIAVFAALAWRRRRSRLVS